MDVSAGFEMLTQRRQPTPMVIMLCIYPSRRHDIVGAERIVADPSADRVLPRQLWQYLRPPDGAGRRRDVARQRAGARFWIA